MPDVPGKEHSSEPSDATGELEALRPWRTVTGPLGHCMHVQERLPFPEDLSVPDLDTLLGDPKLQGFRLSQALFLDIETTGLSHGAGTLAFLVGLAYWEDNQLVFEQLFLDNVENERAMLSRLLDIVARCKYIVSFNGKSFDLSILQSRLVMTRHNEQHNLDLKLLPHLDLLHTARMAYRGVFSNTRLQTLERELINTRCDKRIGDVPGHLVPALYMHYLRTGRAEPLDGVLHHNRWDVLHLVELAVHLLKVIEEPPPNTHPLVLYNLGRAALRLKLNNRAAKLIEASVDGLRHEEQQAALVDLVTAHRRRGDSVGASHAATRALQVTPPWDLTEQARIQRQIKRFSRRIQQGSSVDTDPLSP